MQFQEITIILFQPQKELEFPGGGRSIRTNNVKKCMKLNFLWDEGSQKKIPSMREVWIFSKTTGYKLFGFLIY